MLIVTVLVTTKNVNEAAKNEAFASGVIKDVSDHSDYSVGASKGVAALLSAPWLLNPFSPITLDNGLRFFVIRAPRGDRSHEL